MTALEPVRLGAGIFVDAAFCDDGQILVPLKSLCTELGVEWDGQRRRVRRDPELAASARLFVVQTAGGPQEMLCLPIQVVPQWLYGLDAGRHGEDRRDVAQSLRKLISDDLARTFLAARSSRGESR